MRAALRWCCFLVLGWAVVVVHGPLASAHDLQPGALAMREVAPNTYRVRITWAQDGSGRSVLLAPRFPDACTWTPPTLACSSPLSGEVHFPGLGDARVRVIVHVRALDGSTHQVLMAPGEERAPLAAQAEEEASSPILAALAYLPIGVEHILLGPDHLLFVLGLMLVARGRWRLLGAITGFTVAHSLTLGATVLGLVSAPTATTEWLIAASILLMVSEALREQPGWTGRAPWAVATLFGLIHGFGFAGALLDVGLPEDAVLPALFWFNVGVELGQVAVVVAGLAVAAVLRSRLSAQALHRTRHRFVLVMGVAAAWWTVERALWWWATVA